MERQAVNFVIQASACDLMKVTMERINQALDRMFPFDFKSKKNSLSSNEFLFIYIYIHSSSDSYSTGLFNFTNS